MHLKDMRRCIEDAWEERDSITSRTEGNKRQAVEMALAALNRGHLRVAEKIDGAWQTNSWLKKAVLLSFRLHENMLIAGGIGNNGHWWDKVRPKFSDWNAQDFKTSGFRAVPGSIVRHGAYIAPNVVLMPSFVNIGAYVDTESMIDTWASVGSCAQIGKGVHISGGVGIGGVLEPLQTNPVIIEDNCFIGARSEIVEGVIVEEGAVISMGVFISASTKIVDRETGDVIRGRVPAYSVVVPGSIGGGDGKPALSCAVIIKRVDAQTRAKTDLNTLLRE